jgi:hypothetical protein
VSWNGQQWMDVDKRSLEYIASMHAFLEVAKANKNPRVSCVVHDLSGETTKTTLTWGLFTST